MKRLWTLVALLAFVALSACKSSPPAAPAEPKQAKVYISKTTGEAIVMAATPSDLAEASGAEGSSQGAAAVAEMTVPGVSGNPYAAGGGMWTFHNPPNELLEKLYHFTPSREWLDAVRLSSVRFPGGTGSFVSSTGLVLTNHHVALDTLQKLSSEKKDYVKEGFYAKETAQEEKTKDLKLDVMVSMEDVTARVNGAVKANATAQEAQKQRESEMKAIEKEATEKTKLKCSVYSLYTGGEYWLYSYKTYKDCRLVFAPEQQIAFYGGDPDNFTYPRYDLDFAIFRVYEDDKPASTPNYFKFNPEGMKDGDLVFVSGNPGSTQRLMTMAQLAYSRDHAFPNRLRQLKSSREALLEYSRLGEEPARQAKAQIFGVENSIKAITGYLGGLQNPKLFGRKRAEEADLRAKIAADPKVKEMVGDAFEVLTKTRAKMSENAKRLSYTALTGAMMGNAMTLARLSTEAGKPNSERLGPFTDSRIEDTKKSLREDVPIYTAMEQAQLTAVLRDAKEMLGSDDPFVKAVLGNRQPADVAKELVAGSKMNDAAYRGQLVDGGKAAIDASEDAMILLARKVDPIFRELTKWRETEIDAVERDPANRIAKARFAIYGRTVPPDANFTLRLSPGVVKGYEEDTTLVPYKTTFFGLYERYSAFDGKDPFQLPQRYVEGMGKVPYATPCNFVSTCDIIGGNSGSAVVNRNRELVGLIFDGNIQSLPGNFIYDETDQRAVSVHAAAILATLKHLYDAEPLVNELLAKQP